MTSVSPHLSGHAMSRERGLPRFTSPASPGDFTDVVELCGHDEVVLVQACDLLGLQENGHVAPAEADVGVMPLGFRIGHLPAEAERLGEVPELECSLNPPRLVLNTPVGRLTVMSTDLL